MFFEKENIFIEQIAFCGHTGLKCKCSRQKPKLPLPLPLNENARVAARRNRLMTVELSWFPRGMEILKNHFNCEIGFQDLEKVLSLAKMYMKGLKRFQAMLNTKPRCTLIIGHAIKKIFYQCTR